MAGNDSKTFVAHTFSEEDKHELDLVQLRDDLDGGRHVADALWQLFVYVLLYTRVSLAQTIM